MTPRVAIAIAALLALGACGLSIAIAALLALGACGLSSCAAPFGAPSPGPAPVSPLGPDAGPGCTRACQRLAALCPGVPCDCSLPVVCLSVAGDEGAVEACGVRCLPAGDK